LLTKLATRIVVDWKMRRLINDNLRGKV